MRKNLFAILGRYGKKDRASSNGKINYNGNESKEDLGMNSSEKISAVEMPLFMT